MKFIPSGILSLALLFAFPAVGQFSSEELTARLRQSLEEQFRSSTGLGFSSFQCEISEAPKQRRELTCDAIDEEGDLFFYRIIFRDEDQPPTVTTSQPIDQINPAGREMLERPCIDFLGAFDRSDWPDAYRSFTPELQSAISLAGLEASLEPTRQALGDLREIEANTYSNPSPGIHRLEYALVTEGGDAVARFRLQINDGDRAQIVAFLITSRPGSDLQARLLSDSGRQTLTPLLGQPVEHIEAPLADLQFMGDAVEGVAVMDDGAEIPIRVEQHSTAHDLDGNDYRFQVMDVSWLIRQYLVSTGVTPFGIDCPARTAPDGGQVECSVTMDDGSQRQITIARRGGEHRLLN